MSPDLISPAEAVELLEEAQLSEPHATAILQKLSLNLRTTHPTLTSPLLDLIQLYPHAAIPYLPKILSAAPEDSQQALETLSDLLSADRTLLVPILATLPYLPHAHAQTRPTLIYALQTVDTDDIPAVVRAIVESPTTPSAALWAASTLRRALRRIPPDILPLLSVVLSAACAPGHLVGHALLQRIDFPFGWIDAFVLVTALQNRDGPHHVTFSYVVGRLKALGAGMLSGDIAAVLNAFETVIGAGDASAVRVIVQVLAGCLIGVEGVVNFGKLVRVFLKACPQAAVGAVEELLSSCEDVLLAVLDVLPRAALRVAEECNVPRVRVAVARKEDAWEKLFILMRKGLLFGNDNERRHALECGAQIIRLGQEKLSRDAIEVLDASIAEGLSDPLAVGVLDIIGRAVIQGIVQGDQAGELLRKRLERKCPKALVKEIRGADADRNSTSELRVDIGLIWSQSISTISAVVSSAVALTLATDPHTSTESIASKMLDVLVLVPVVCIPLYHAVEDCKQDFDIRMRGSAKRQSTAAQVHRNGERTFPSDLLQADTRDLATAVSSFGAAMSAIVGILNLSCTCVSMFRGLLSQFGRSRNLSKPEKAVVWALLERLTELDRMLNALLLGHEVLHTRLSGENGDVSFKQNSPDEISSQAQREARSKADKIKEAVVQSIYILDGSASNEKASERGFEEAFPQISLPCVICSLIAVPDEAGIESITDESICKQTRDVELARIDKMLLRHLFRMVDSCKTKKSPTRRESKHTSARNTSSRAPTSSFGNWNLRKSQLEIAALARQSNRAQRSFAGNVFFLPEDAALHGDVEDTDKVPPGDKWAENPLGSGVMDSTYLRYSVLSAMNEKGGLKTRQSDEAASMIQTPAFAALLLDRAATYICVARRARQSSAEDSYLSTCTTVAGFALGCLNSILRTVPMMERIPRERTSKEEANVRAANTALEEFVKAIDDRLLVSVGEESQEHILGDSVTCESKTVAILVWASATSIDVTVATLCFETLLILSEFGLVSFNYVRTAILRSLTTVYEYTGNDLWAWDDQCILFQDPYTQWSIRRRHAKGDWEASISNGRERNMNPSPWVDLGTQGYRYFKGIEKHRLRVFFNGMHLPGALLEASGWVREIAYALLRQDDESVPGHKSSKGLLQGNDLPNEVVDPWEFKGCDPSRCQNLLDMVGFRNVLETLLQLVQQAIDVCRVPETLAIEDASDEATSPIINTRHALGLFSSIVRVYTKTHGAKFKARGAPPTSQLDHLLLTFSSSILQLTRVRLGNIQAWYSNPQTDLSTLSDKTAECLEQMIGCAITSVGLCSEICDSIKAQYASMTIPATSNVEQGTNKGTKRKRPGFARTRRKKGGVGDEEASKARRLVPKLTTQCEAVAKEAQELARLMGFRGKKALHRLAQVLPDEDKNMSFGVGLGSTATENTAEICKQGAAEREEDRGEDVEEDSGGEFRARRPRGGSSTAEPRTITVTFNR